LLTPIADDNMDPKPDARIFDFQQNAAATNYEDLGHYIHVLSVALSSIDAYATRDAPQTPRKQVKKDSEKPASLLEMIRHALHVMYEKISTSALVIHLTSTLAHVNTPQTIVVVHSWTGRGLRKLYSTSNSG
jgi:hypothetical protein